MKQNKKIYNFNKNNETYLRFNLVLILSFFISVVHAQNSFLIPSNQPNAYTDYVYAENEIMMKTETYKSQAPKFSIPTKSSGLMKEDLQLDVYYTAINENKFAAKKPLIIFAPGVGDNRSQVQFICKDLARRGYVTASISTRDINPFWLALFANDLKSNPTKKKILNPFMIYTAAMDLHLAINFLIKDRAQAYGINSEFVIIGGGSKGGATVLQAAFMDKKEADASFGKAAAAKLGMNADVYDDYFNDFDESLQKNAIKGVIAFYGAVYNLSFISPQEKIPVYMFHGNKDPFVPYKNNNMMYDPSDVMVYGSAEIAKHIKSIGNSYCIITGKEVGHTITPGCNYDVNEFPKGYPMNWYPEMLQFLKKTIIDGQTIQFQKVVECTLANGCNPAMDAATAKCRAVSDNVSVASNSMANSSPVELGKSTFSDLTFTTPVQPTNSSPNSAISQKPQATTTNNISNIEHCSAFVFSGNAFVKINASPTLNSNSVIIDFWYKKSGTIPAGKANIFYTSGNDDNLNNSMISIGFVGENAIGLHIKNPKSKKTSGFLSPIPAIDENWHHYAIVYYKTKFDFYIDGKRAVSRTIPFCIETKNTNHYIGGSPYTTSSTNIKFANTVGQIDNFRYWTNIPNLADENAVSKYIMNPAIVDSTFLAGFWKLDENNQKVKDVSKNNNHGIMGNTEDKDTFDPIFVKNCGAGADK